jgi:hypothetical protein
LIRNKVGLLELAKLLRGLPPWTPRFNRLNDPFLKVQRQ